MTCEIALLSAYMETNSFSSLPVAAGRVSREGLLSADETQARFGGAETEIAGFLDALRDEDVRVRFLPGFWMMPGGPLTPEARRMIEGHVEDGLRALDRAPDALLLSLHGCLAARDEPDVTGRLLARLRTRIGAVPMVATVDFHANVTLRFQAALDAMVGYRTYPHRDLRETGRRAARILLKRLRDPRPMACVSARLPLIAPVETTQDDRPPMRDVWRRLAELEERRDCVASCLCPHPWLNAPEFAVCLLAVGERDRAAEMRDELGLAAGELWRARDQLQTRMPSIEELWPKVEASRERPVLLVDSGDVVLAGAPGDSTAVLRFLESRETELRCLLSLTDPEAVRRLQGSRPGTRADAQCGARWTEDPRGPIRLSVEVIATSREPYVGVGPYLRGVALDPGVRVALRWGRHALVLTERPDPAHDPAFYLSVGLDPADYDVVVVKSHNSFAPAYAPISRNVMRAATPGATDPDLRRLPYAAPMRELSPLGEPDFSPEATLHV